MAARDPKDENPCRRVGAHAHEIRHKPTDDQHPGLPDGFNECYQIIRAI
jgi:hypothetical protein